MYRAFGQYHEGNFSIGIFVDKKFGFEFWLSPLGLRFYTAAGVRDNHLLSVL